MASVSCISPPFPGSVFSKYSNIFGVSRYLPRQASLDGASSILGFSTKSAISTVFSSNDLDGFTIPYLETSDSFTS